jgi:hypothetical protein
MAERHVVALQTMIGKAEDRLKPYEQVDWALAAAKLSAEDYQQLKTAHEVLSTDVKFLKEELDGKVSEHREKQIERVNKPLSSVSRPLPTLSTRPTSRALTKRPTTASATTP